MLILSDYINISLGVWFADTLWRILVNLWDVSLRESLVKARRKLFRCSFPFNDINFCLNAL